MNGKQALLALTAGCSVAIADVSNAADHLSNIKGFMVDSSCAKKNWKARGRAPQSYVDGIGLVFARSVCQPERADVKVVSQGVDPSTSNTDALAHYNDIFIKRGLNNSAAGLDTLRHSYVLLLGVGMMESSGKFCEGRDVSQCFNDPDSAEAGLFQTSYGVRKANPVLTELFQKYGSDQEGCMLNQFKGNLSCAISRSHNAQCPDATSDVVGTGPGADWQRLTKSCPAFATEYAAVVLRTSGGAKGEFGPIRKKKAEVDLGCEAMLKAVQAYVQAHPDACASLVSMP